jgi:hypothetical protein
MAVLEVQAAAVVVVGLLMETQEQAGQLLPLDKATQAEMVIHHLTQMI